MRDSLGISTLAYALVLSCWCLGSALANRTRSAGFVAALLVLECAAIGQALLDGLALLDGRAGAQASTNLSYLVTSVLLLPVTAAAVRLDRRRWGSAGLAVGCLLFAVVTIRLHQTLRPTSA